jgi:hypothetical protein
MAKAKRAVIARVPLAKIDRTGGTQARVGNNEDAVAEYTEALRAGKSLPPPVVFKDEKGTLWLADGFHRVEAHARIGAKTLDVEQHVGDQRAARLYAAGANAQHGLRRSNDDKRRAVAMLMDDPEWREWSDRAIAEHCHVSRELVAAVRASTGRNGQLEPRKSADGKTRDVSAIAESNRERAEAKRAAAPRVTREAVDELPPDDVPEIEAEETFTVVDPVHDESPVEDGPATAPPGPVDATGYDVPAHLLDQWAFLSSMPPVVDRALAEAARHWSTLADRMLAAVRKTGSDRHWPTREHGTIDNDFGPAGRVHAVQAAIRRLVPHVVCRPCEGRGCERCGQLGWFSRVAWRERERVDERLDAVGVTVHR